MSDHDIIPPVNMDTSDTLQRRNQNKRQDRKKKRQEAHPRLEPKAPKDQDVQMAPENDHLIDYEA